jgi:hypothetical protein
MKRSKKAKRQRVRAGVRRGGDSYQPYSGTIITEDAPLVNKPATGSPVSLVSGANYGALAHLLAQARQREHRHLQLARRHRRIRQALEALAARKAVRQ